MVEENETNGEVVVKKKGLKRHRFSFIHIVSFLFVLIVVLALGSFFLANHARAGLAADFNGDGVVNGADLTILKAHWGNSATSSTGDANNDSKDNVYDLAILANELGQGTLTNNCNTPGVYNVMCSPYDAKGDGVTDDSGAIQAAFMAANNSSACKTGTGVCGTVLLPSGYTYAVATPWNMPTIRTNDWVGATPTVQRSGTIAISGYGATIKYTNLTARFAWLQTSNPSVEWGTYGNLDIEGISFDNNYRAPSAEVGTIIWAQGHSNFTNITIQDVKMYDVARRTGPSTPENDKGVYLKPTLPNTDQPHTAYTTDITVNNANIQAQGKGVGIVVDDDGETALVDVPYLMDNILVENSTVDMLGTIGTGIHIGGKAAGNSVKIINDTVTDSTDNLIEVDAFNNTLIQNCTLSKGSSGVGFSWFSYPYNNTTPSGPEPQYVIDGCKYIGGNNPYWPEGATEPPVYSSASYGSVQLGGAATELKGRDWGDYIIENSSATQNGNDYANYWNGMFTFTIPFHSLTMTNDTINNVNMPAGTHYSVVVGHKNELGTKAPVNISNLTINTTGAASTAIRLMGDMALNASGINVSLPSGTSGNKFISLGQSLTPYTNDFTGTIDQLNATSNTIANALELAVGTFKLTLSNSNLGMLQTGSSVVSDLVGNGGITQVNVTQPGK